MWKARHTNWDSATGKHHDEWIQMDFGKVQKFNEIWTQFEYATFFYQYKIETSIDGKTWSNMPGSPITVRAEKLKVGAYQTTYSQNFSWAKMSNYVIYTK